VTTVPDCAARCSLVTTLVIERARDRGTSEQHERITHGLPGEDRPAADSDTTEGA
jgi:hypothetical protein